MELNIRGDKISVTKAIKDYVTDKMNRLNKYFDNEKTVVAEILIRVRNNEQIIEVTVPTSRFTLRAEERNSDLYAAIDEVVDKLERQIRKNKTRLNRKFKNNVIPEMNMAFEVTEEEEDEKKIMRRKDFEMKPMDEEEAILQMELLGHDFFIFKNESEGCTSVVYKRKNETYGIINVR